MRFDSGPLVAIHFEIANGTIESSHLSLSDAFVCSGANQPLLDWLWLYTKGISSVLPLVTGSSFQELALQALQKVPFGKTISYGELASLCGHPRAARAAGNACNRNRFPLLIPCHRIVRSTGEMGGFASDLEIKRRLLEFEAKEGGRPSNSAH